MKPTAKYLLARVVLFAVFTVPFLFFLDLPFMNLPLALVLGMIISMVVSMFLLKNMREEMIVTIDKKVAARRKAKAEFRSELAGDKK